MPRVKGGVTQARKRKRLMRKASGFVNGPGNIYRQAIEFVARAGRYSYRDRKQKKRHFRQLWIVRLNAALKERGVSYNRFIPAAIAAGITLNRKMLSEIAISDPATFDTIVAQVKPHIAKPKAKAAA